MAIIVGIRRLPHAEGLPLPEYKSAGASGMDLCAAVPPDGVYIRVGQRLLIPTGFCIELPPYFEAQVRPRSGLALKYGITVLNAPGTVDSDYRGELKVLLINLGSNAVHIERGDRIAQLVIQRVDRVQWLPTESLDATSRGEQGFGSTGVS